MHDRRVLMIAAENDALPGAKVGGVGDVVRDLPNALMKEGMAVETIIPSYGFLARLDNVETVGKMRVKFASHLYDVDVLKLHEQQAGCDHYIIHHEEFSKKGERIYNDDDNTRPFASDATKFAFFCTCVAQALVYNIVPRPNVLHCHDWHTAFLLILVKFNFQYASLRHIKTVFTVHNLAMQGIRPYSGDESSFNQWFPDLRYSVDKLTDPRYPDCVNPMRAAILLADKIHTVSPSYAKEILKTSHHELGIYGGDGLENDLKERMDNDDLFGILNGCEYPEDLDVKPLSRTALVQAMQASVALWAASDPVLKTAHWLADKSINTWKTNKNKGITITSVGRLTEQKVRVLHTLMSNGKTALQGVLDTLGDQGTLILLGSGNPDLEVFMCEAAAQNKNFIFLNGYSDEMSKALYNFGDVFLMPSSFEPCGISQMLAMRAGQPCLVNAVGGLKDTIQNNHNGFVFQGDTISEQAEALVSVFEDVLTRYKNDEKTWREMCAVAKQTRFTWEQSAKRYIEELYN